MPENEIGNVDIAEGKKRHFPTDEGLELGNQQSKNRKAELSRLCLLHMNRLLVLLKNQELCFVI